MKRPDNSLAFGNVKLMQPQRFSHIIFSEYETFFPQNFSHIQHLQGFKKFFVSSYGLIIFGFSVSGLHSSCHIGDVGWNPTLGASFLSSSTFEASISESDKY